MTASAPEYWGIRRILRTQAVKMRSLSTNLGQPNETIPMVDCFALRLSVIFAFAVIGAEVCGFVSWLLTLRKTDWKDHISAEFGGKGGLFGFGTNFPALGMKDHKG